MVKGIDILNGGQMDEASRQESKEGRKQGKRKEGRNT